MRIILGMIIGAIMGFLLAYFAQCASRVCPLNRNPALFIILCAVFGGMLAKRIK